VEEVRGVARQVGVLVDEALVALEIRNIDLCGFEEGEGVMQQDQGSKTEKNTVRGSQVAGTAAPTLARSVR
jgi:hypothetical protein